MDDLSNVGTFFLIFAALLALYGLLLTRTGSKDLMPIQSVHSIRGPQDVKRVGRIVIIVGCVIGIVSLVLLLVTCGR